MQTIEQMSKETLLHILKYKDARIKELEKEIELYRRIIDELTEKYGKADEK